MTHPSKDLAELEVEELEAQLDALGVAPFHARQLYRWIYRHGVSDIDRMTDLGRPLRAMLKAEFVLTTPRMSQGRGLNRRDPQVPPGTGRQTPNRGRVHP